MKKKIVFCILALFLTLCIGGLYLYKILMTSNVETKEPQYLLIYPGQGYDSILDNLKETGAIKDFNSFKLIANFSGYKDKIHTGRYELTNGLSNLRLIQKLIYGRQTPVRFTFNNIRTKDQFAEKVSEKLMMSKEEFINVLDSEETLKEYNLTKENNLVIFLPNTYEFYWDITPKNFLSKMKKEYDKFWTTERQSKLKECGLSQVEASILASIVEEETIKNDERPKVAGLYINRLKIGMLLQADPTVKFALGDFSLKRVSGGFNQIDSPYNTYKYQGLPPGPIRIPSEGGIDAVLNYEHHNYLFMCAKRDFSGYHDFTTTFGEHQNNARQYHKKLDKIGIK